MGKDQEGRGRVEYFKWSLTGEATRDEGLSFVQWWMETETVERERERLPQCTQLVNLAINGF